MQIKVIACGTVRLGQMKVNGKFYQQFFKRWPLRYEGEWRVLSSEAIASNSRTFAE